MKILKEKKKESKHKMFKEKGQGMELAKDALVLAGGVAILGAGLNILEDL